MNKYRIYFKSKSKKLVKEEEIIDFLESELDFHTEVHAVDEDTTGLYAIVSVDKTISPDILELMNNKVLSVQLIIKIK